jgi:hypothetical protein
MGSFCLLYLHGREGRQILIKSSLAFSTVYLGVCDMSGLFGFFEETIMAYEEGFSDEAFELPMAVKSIATEEKMRDNYLCSEDFSM